MSVASVNVLVVESEDDVCILTIKVLVSALLSVRRNLWSTSEESTVYLVVINEPS
jgi:hypothetical protein